MVFYIYIQCTIQNEACKPLGSNSKRRSIRVDGVNGKIRFPKRKKKEFLNHEGRKSNSQILISKGRLQKKHFSNVKLAGTCFHQQRIILDSNQDCTPKSVGSHDCNMTWEKTYTSLAWSCRLVFPKQFRHLLSLRKD